MQVRNNPKKSAQMLALGQARKFARKHMDEGRSMVDELIAERRAEATREEKEYRKSRPITAEQIAYLMAKFSKNKNTQIVAKKSITKSKKHAASK